MAIAEGMIHGAVPVSTEFIGIHQEAVIQDCRTGLLFPCDRPDIAVKAIKTLFDAEYLNTLRSAATRMISDNFTLEQFGERWDAALRRCLTAEKRPREFKGHPVRLSLAERVKEGLRKRLRLQIKHGSPRAEWPMMSPRDPDLTGKIVEALQASAQKKSNKTSAQ